MNGRAHRLRRLLQKEIMSADTKYFDCLACGRESEVVATPPRCAECGSGSGVISPHRRAEQQDRAHEAFQRAAKLAKGKAA
jgi:hypothetical protein